jgi:uroporphyrinogen-III synthase
MEKILITAEKDDVVLLLEHISEIGIEPCHLPLEQYEYFFDSDQNEALLQQMDSFQFVVYGKLRNARNFITWVGKTKMMDKIQEKIHLVMNQPETDLLEEAGIPVIKPKETCRPIDIMEFLLRITINGAVLYPCAEGSSEEVPGLLEELEMPVAEFTVCKSVPFKKEIIEIKKEKLSKLNPDAILFHSRGSVVRTRTAFPELDLTDKKLVAASAGVAYKMRQENLEPDYTATGSWMSVIEKLREINDDKI